MRCYMKKWLFLAFLGFYSLNAEILSVQLIWNPANCDSRCATSFGQQFQRIPGVAGIQLNPGAGSADLAWTPGAPLQFSPINAAFSMVGPSIQDFRVSVRGNLIAQGNTFTLSSVGDNTQFLLLGALQQQPGRWTVPYNYNPVNYPLSTELFQQLSLVAQQRQVIVVSGQILAPERSPPWMLIVRNVEVQAAPAIVQPGYNYYQPQAQPFLLPGRLMQPAQRPQPVQRQQPQQFQR